MTHVITCVYCGRKFQLLSDSNVGWSIVEASIKPEEVGQEQISPMCDDCVANFYEEDQ